MKVKENIIKNIKYDNSFYSIEENYDGIYEVIFKSNNLTFEIFQLYKSDFESIVGIGVRVQIIIKDNLNFVQIDKKSREYIASEYFRDNALEIALVARNKLNMYLINFLISIYLKIHQYEIKAFSNSEDARKWLKSKKIDK